MLLQKQLLSTRINFPQGNWATTNNQMFIKLNINVFMVVAIFIEKYESVYISRTKTDHTLIFHKQGLLECD